MEWPKLKNIVLVILTVTNLCLLVLAARQTMENDRLQRQARQDAIQFLAERAVIVAEDQVPDEMTLLPQQVGRDLEAEGTLAAQLLGAGVQVEKRGGEVYRYFNDQGSIQFHSDGAFQAEFPVGAFPAGSDRKRTCLDLLAKLDYEGELLEEGENTLIFRQVWQGAPLFTQQVTLKIEEGSITAMTAGRRLVGQPTEDLSRSVVTVSTALFQLFNGISALGDVCSSIDAITQGYVSTTSLSGPMTLTPVWRVTTDTSAYQLDLVTGDLTRSP